MISDKKILRIMSKVNAGGGGGGDGDGGGGMSNADRANQAAALGFGGGGVAGSLARGGAAVGGLGQSPGPTGSGISNQSGSQNNYGYSSDLESLSSYPAMVKQAEQNLRNAVIAGGGGGGMNSEAEQRSWDIDAGYVPTPQGQVTPQEQLSYGRQAFNKAFTQDSPYTQAQLEAIRADAQRAYDQLSFSEKLRDAYSGVNTGFSGMYANIAGEEGGPYLRQAFNTLSPLNPETTLGPIAGLAGLLAGEPVGFKTPQEAQEFAATAERDMAGREGRGEMMGSGDLTRNYQPVSTIQQGSGQGQTAATKPAEKDPYASMKFGALVPTLKLGGRTLADILMERGQKWQQ